MNFFVIFSMVSGLLVQLQAVKLLSLIKVLNLVTIVVLLML